MREARRAFLVQNGRPTKVTKLVKARTSAAGGDYIAWSARPDRTGPNYIFWQYFPRTKSSCKTWPERISADRFLQGSIVLGLFINEDEDFLVHLQVRGAGVTDR